MVIIGLGSNVGERGAMLDAGVAALGGLLSGMRCSQRIETPALLLPDSPPEWNMPFLNMAVAGECAFAPQDLLRELKRLEPVLGREDRGRWGPREIDLDILYMDGVEMCTPELTIPHAELLKRHFALAPLVELAPEVMIQGKMAKDWLLCHSREGGNPDPATSAG